MLYPRSSVACGPRTRSNPSDARSRACSPFPRAAQQIVQFFAGRLHDLRTQFERTLRTGHSQTAILLVETAAISLQRRFGHPARGVFEGVETLAFLLGAAARLAQERPASGRLQAFAGVGHPFEQLPVEKLARGGELAQSSPVSGTISSAAALGVGARRSAAKSAMVKSISCPMAETIGTSEA